MNENYYNDEQEIDLIDMMFYLLRQWRTLLIAVVLGAVLGGVIYTMKKPAEVVPPTPVPMESESVEPIESYRPEPDVKAKMDLAYRYRQLYAQQLEYNEKSLIMQMDPGEVYTGELEYYLAAGDHTRLLGELFANILSDEALLSDLKDAANLDCEEQYLNEIVSGSIRQESDATVNINNSVRDVSKNTLVSYSVSYMDKESCEKMLDVIRERVEVLNQEYKEIYGNYILEPVNDSVRLLINNDYLDRQKSIADAINNYLANIMSLESGFSGDDLNYYRVVYLSREAIKDTVEEIVVTEAEVFDSTRELVKWVVIGILLLCCLWGGFYLVKYLMDAHIKTESDVQNFGLQVIGRTGSEEKNGNWINRLNQKRKGAYDTPEYIASAVDALHKQNILLCLDQRHAEAKKLAEGLASEASGITLGNQVHLDSAALELAKKMDGVILIVGIGHTLIRELQRELDVCRIQEISVLGVIMIDER